MKIKTLSISNVNNIMMNEDSSTILFTETIDGYMLFSILPRDGLYIYSGVRNTHIETNSRGIMLIKGVDIV